MAEVLKLVSGLENCRPVLHSTGGSLLFGRRWFAAFLLADVESQQGENLFHLWAQLTGKRVPKTGAKRFFYSAISHWSSGDYSGLPRAHYSYQSHRTLNSSSRGNPYKTGAPPASGCVGIR